MPGPAPTDDGLDCLVVGGGLGGLSTAVELVRAGRSVHVVEAERSAGGRARTAWHGGRPVDVGFQALFSGYPATRAFLRAIGIPRRDLRPVGGGAAFHDGAGWARLRPGVRGLATFAGLGAGDRTRLALLAAEVAALSPEVLLGGLDEETTTEEYLRARGFSASAVEAFFRPLFGAVTLDRTLSADAAYFRFLLAMLVRGPAVMPSDGHGMIAEWASAAVRKGGGTVETGACALGLEADPAGRRVVGVRMADGRRLRARQVVLAVASPAARDLLESLDPVTAARLPRDQASVATAAFALARPLYRGRVVLLNAAGGDADGPRVDLVCQTTNVTRPGAPRGPHIVLASAITTGGGGCDGLIEAVGRLMVRWAPAFPWADVATPIAVHEHPCAQFRPLPGVRRRLPGHRTAIDNLILSGDMTTHPSVEGAIAAGARAAGIVDALIP